MSLEELQARLEEVTNHRDLLLKAVADLFVAKGWISQEGADDVDPDSAFDGPILLMLLDELTEHHRTIAGYEQVLEFGHGDVIIGSGPKSKVVRVSQAINGAGIGVPVEEENIGRHLLLMTFPTVEQAHAVYRALSAKHASAPTG